MKLSVVVPAYNEEDALSESLKRICEYVFEQDPLGLISQGGTEILIVDDGSTDRTVEIVSREAAKWPRVRVLSNETNRGKGFSVARGVLESAGERVLFTDADLSTPIEELGKLWSALDSGAQVAIGSRARPESDVRIHQPWYREIMGKTFNLMVRLLAAPGIRDTQCGFKLFEGDLARNIFAKMKISGFAFDVEILRLARRQGARIAEVGVQWFDSRSTKVRVVADSAKMLRDLIRIRIWELTGAYKN